MRLHDIDEECCRDRQTTPVLTMEELDISDCPSLNLVMARHCLGLQLILNGHAGLPGYPRVASDPTNRLKQ